MKKEDTEVITAKKPITVDCTPSWEHVLPLFISAIETDDYDSKSYKAAVAELERMAKIADLYVQSQKKK